MTIILKQVERGDQFLGLVGVFFDGFESGFNKVITKN